MLSALRLPRLTDRWTRFLLAPALVFIATCVDRNYQTDLWHHLARGRAIVAEGRLLDTERFTFTMADKPFQDVNWLWQVGCYYLHDLGGLPLVQTANSAILALMMTGLLILAWRRSQSLPVAAGVCIVAFFGLWQLLIIRPQTVSFLLFVVLYANLEGATRRRWLLAFAPLIMALWTNCHGGFPVGLVLVGAYVLAQVLEAAVAHQQTPRSFLPALLARWPWLMCLAGCLAATLLNPYGWRVYDYVLVTSATASARHIDEWLPPSPSLLIGKVWIASILFMLAACAVPGRRPTIRELCLMGVFLPFSFGSVRMVAWWLLIAAPILAAQLAANVPWWTPSAATKELPSRGAAFLCAALLFVMLLSLPWLERVNPVMALPGRGHRQESDLQALSERIAAEKPNARVFTRFAWGEYLTWSLDSRGKVFMDGRIEIIPDDVWTQYTEITRGRPEWEAILDRYDVDYLILDTTGYHHDLLPLVEQSPKWHAIAAQGNAILFSRDAQRAAIHRWPINRAPRASRLTAYSFSFSLIFFSISVFFVCSRFDGPATSTPFFQASIASTLWPSAQHASAR